MNDLKKEVDKKLECIYSKLNDNERDFLSYLINNVNSICEKNFKAIEYAESHLTTKNKTDNNLKKIIEILKGC